MGNSQKLPLKANNNTFSTSRFKVIRNIILTSVAVSLIFFGGYFVGYRGFVANLGSGRVSIDRINPEDHSDLDFSLFWRILDIVTKENLSDEIRERDLVYGAIS